MNEHPAFLVYSHLGPFLRERGFAPADPGALELPRERFVSGLTHSGFFRLDAAPEKGGGGALAVFVLAPGGKYATQGPMLKQLLGPLGAGGAPGGGLEAIVVAPDGVLAKSNMLEAVRAVRAGAPPGLLVTLLPYRVLSLDVPRARAVPRHEIVPPAEARAFLERERLAPRDLPGISAMDPPVVWIGGRPGQVVRVTRPSETAGYALDYRLVRP